MKRILAVLLMLVAPMLAAVPALAGEPTQQAVLVGVRHNMEATLYTPDGPGPFPTVLLMHTSFGLTETDKGYCLKLAREGFICIVPAFLLAHGNLRGNLRQLSFTTAAQEIYDDFVEVIGELNRLPKAKPGAVGAIGFSNGGYFALWLAATRQVKAGISYYGALQGAGTDNKLTRFENTFTAQSSPVMVLSGQDDSTIGIQVVHHFIGILKRKGAPYEAKIYPDAEHDFDRTSLRRGNEAAGADAWLRTLTFFRKYLE
jgi:carboxymethylenebutenolidase